MNHVNATLRNDSIRRRTIKHRLTSSPARRMQLVQASQTGVVSLWRVRPLTLNKEWVHNATPRATFIRTNVQYNDIYCHAYISEYKSNGMTPLLFFFIPCVFSFCSSHVCMWLDMTSQGTYRRTLRKHEAETHAVHRKQRSTWTHVQTNSVKLYARTSNNSHFNMDR